MPQINQINSNPIQNLQPNVSGKNLFSLEVKLVFFFSFEDYMNYNDLTALQRLSQLTPSALSALTQLAASSFPGLNSLAGLFRDLI
jgi:hypothetical protein